MARNLDRFNKSKRDLKKQIAVAYGHDVNDESFKEGFNEYAKKAVEDRIGQHTKRILQKFPTELVGRVLQYAQDNLSPMEFENSEFEAILVKYLGENPDEVNAKDFERIFNPKTGKLRPFVKDPLSDGLRWPDVAKSQQTGEFHEISKQPRLMPSPPAMPSQRQLSKMGSEEIGKIISQAKSAGVEE